MASASGGCCAWLGLAVSSSSGAFIIKNDTQRIVSQIQALAGQAVYAGVPSDKTDRTGAGAGSPPTNAEIAYWMEFGVPSKNIPARPSIVPGVKMALGRIIRHLKDGAKDTLDTGDPAGVTEGLHKAGIEAVSSIKRNRK